MKMLLLLLLLVSQHASAVEVYEGVESVLLPCQVPEDVAKDATAAVWDRKELSTSTVHVRLQSGDDFKEQNDRYANRTSMSADALQTGGLSLTLRNPTVSDSGAYTCTTRRYGQDQSKTYVDLKVTERPPPPVWPIVLSAVLVPVVLLAAGFGVFIYPRYKMLKMRKDYPVDMVEVAQEKSVLLPFKVDEDDVPQDVKVEWKHQNMKVHVYQNNEHQHLLKDEDYRDRTEMKEEPVTNKDFSLTLKDPQLNDHGGYTCTVYNKEGYILLQKVVLLNVTVFQVEMVEVTQGEKSVLLPLQIKDIVPLYETLLWRRGNVVVHTYPRHQRQPVLIGEEYEGRTEMKEDPLGTGDFSLTLKDLRLTDSGIYTCTVYNKDGHMLLQKSVTLSVRVPEVQMVETVKGVQSVLLPFTTDIKQQDVTVEWKHEDRKVPQGRTEMKKNALRPGDFSLTLKDLHLTDSGVYTCTVYNKDGHMLLQKSLTLSIRDYQSGVVEVTQGQQSVLMPFKSTRDLPQGTKVEWRLTHPEEKMVHCNHSSQKQDQVYVGRTEMHHDDLKNKDLSLKLKDLHLADSGVYTCTVYNKDGHMLLQKSVTLSVRVPEVQMVETVKGVQSVLLPFTTDIKQQDVTVEWKHEGRKVPQGQTEMKKNALRPGDFSLTLKDLRLTDSGVYTCTVYNKDGHMLLQKSVTLSVRVPEVQMVETVKGVQSVLLPFTTDIKQQDVTVEWKHEDKKVPQGRTEMKKNAPRPGDFSLTLKDLRLTDSGVYTCTIYNKDGHMLLQKSVTLSVRDYQSGVVEVTQGQQSVLMPFKSTRDLPQGTKVEWRLTHPEEKMVHCNHSSQKQDQVYVGRTEMHHDDLKNKDLSLTLKDLHLTDSGVYTCTVYNKDGHMLLQKSVTLSVRVPEVQMVETVKGVQSVLLPLTTDIKQQDVTVEWKHEDRKVPQGRTEMKKNALRPGDFSLTMKDLHLTDSGVYTCTIYNKDGHMLLQKSVTLSVRDYQSGVVEVTQGQQSVLMPFKSTRDLPQGTKVEWRLTHPEEKMVHCNHSSQKQDQVYVGRTEMHHDDLKNKDLSLTLKDLQLSDSGVYTCTVYNKDGHMLLQKSVALSVRGESQASTSEVATTQKQDKAKGESQASTSEVATTQKQDKAKGSPKS